MKKLKLIPILLFVAAGIATAAVYGYVSIAIGATTIPATIEASSTSNIIDTVAIDVRKSESVAFQWKFNHAGAGTDNNTVTFGTSVDGVDYSATAAAGTFTWVVAGNGTTGQTAVTNITVKPGVGYMKIISIQNGVAEIMTNSHFRYSQKIRSK